jgi:hypothetical protein
VSKTRLGNLFVLLRSHSADTHCTNDLAIHNDWHATLKLDTIGQGDNSRTGLGRFL